MSASNNPSSSGAYVEPDAFDLEPDEQWKDEMAKKIDDQYAQMVQDAKNNRDRELEKAPVSEEERQRLTDEYTAAMANIRKLCAEELAFAVEKERHQRLWLAGKPIGAYWEEMFKEEQQRIMDEYQKDGALSRKEENESQPPPSTSTRNPKSPSFSSSSRSAGQPSNKPMSSRNAKSDAEARASLSKEDSDGQGWRTSGLPKNRSPQFVDALDSDQALDDEELLRPPTERPKGAYDLRNLIDPPVPRTNDRPPPRPSYSTSRTEIWMPSISPEEDALASKHPYMLNRRGSTASMRSTGSGGVRPSIAEAIPERADDMNEAPRREKRKSKDTDNMRKQSEGAKDRERESMGRYRSGSGAGTDVGPRYDDYPIARGPPVRHKASFTAEDYPPPIPSPGRPSKPRASFTSEDRPYPFPPPPHSRHNLASKSSFSGEDRDRDRVGRTWSGPPSSGPWIGERDYPDPSEPYDIPAYSRRELEGRGNTWIAAQYSEAPPYRKASEIRPTVNRQGSFSGQRPPPTESPEDGYYPYQHPSSGGIPVPKPSPQNDDIAQAWRAWHREHQRPDHDYTNYASGPEPPTPWKFRSPPSSYQGSFRDPPHSFGGREARRPNDELSPESDDEDRHEEMKRREEEAIRREEEAERREQEVKKKEEEAKRKEQEAKRKEADARRKEEEARRKEEEARRKEEEAGRREEEARRKEEEARKRADEARRLEDEASRKVELVRQKEEAMKKKEQEVSRMEEDVLRMAEDANRRAQEATQREKEALEKEQIALQKEREAKRREREIEQRAEETRRMEAEARRKEEELASKEAEARKLEEEARVKEADAIRKAQAAVEKERETRKKEEEIRRKEEDLERREADLKRKDDESSRRDAERLKKEWPKESQETERRRVSEEIKRAEAERRRAEEAKRQQQEEEKRREHERHDRQQQEQYHRREEEIRRRAEERKRQDSTGAENISSSAYPSPPPSTSRASRSGTSATANPATEKPASPSTRTSTGSAWSTKSGPSSSNSTGTSSGGQKPRSGSTTASFTSDSSYPNVTEDDWKRRQAENFAKQQEQFRREQEKLESARQAKEMGRIMTRDEVIRRFDKHEQQWASLNSKTALLWANFPWPLFKTPADPSEIVLVGVEAYMSSPYFPDKDKSAKDRIRDHIKRWHPDRFETKLLPKVIAEDKERVREAAGTVARILNELLNRENANGPRPFKD